MRNISVYHVDAFTTERFGGNPAGVIPEAEQLTEVEMQKIANELNLPESAFLLPTTNSEADFKVRYFTPAEEIDFCGHATVALSWILATKYEWMNKKDELVFETNIGLIPVKWVKENQTLRAVSMTQVAPMVKEFPVEAAEIARLVGVPLEEIDEKYPIQLGYTGNWHLLVPVQSRKAIDAAQPQLKELATMNRDYKIATTHLFTFDTQGEFDLYTRDFAPAVGIDEDPVTGSANGALAAYLYLEKILPIDKNIHHLKIGQGHQMGRPGVLYATVTKTENSAMIEVAGSAVLTIEGKLTL